MRRAARRALLHQTASGGGAPFAADHWVAPTGSDTTGTGTEANPKKTIQAGFNLLSTGQTLGVRFPAGSAAYAPASGNYVLSTTGAGSGGTLASPKHIKAYPGEVPRCNGRWLVDASHIRVAGLYLDVWTNGGAFEDPLRIGSGGSGSGSVAHVWFSDCEVDGLDQDCGPFLLGGSISYADDVVIERCKVHNFQGLMPSHGVYASHALRPIIRDCIFYEHGNISLVGSRAVQLYPNCMEARVERCIMDQCVGGIVFGTNNTTDLSSGHVFDKNIITNTGSRAAWGSVWNDSSGGTPPAANVNAIVSNNHTHALGAGGTISGPEMTVSGTTTGDPLYTNAAGGVYLPLGAGSPAAGKGPA